MPSQESATHQPADGLGSILLSAALLRGHGSTLQAELSLLGCHGRRINDFGR